jgi:serine/threonine protein kinase/streptogramin lyase
MAVGSDPRPGSEIAGFRLEELLGRGGMGAVYRAEDVRLGRKVALKLLVPELAESERFRERFLRESQIAASLDHPHIVPIYAAGEADGQLYLAMRYVKGYDLRQLIAREAPLDPDRALRLVEQVGDALDAAHERGLIHRDVKPANILIAPRTGREHCYLTDFGLTKQTSSISGLTGTGELVGTVEYVSPEQIRGELVDGRTDVYSLGCVLYECLAGQRPFARESEVATLWAHVNEPPPALAATHPELGHEIDAVMARSLAKTPQDRYESCSELVASARAALGLPELSSSMRPRPKRARGLQLRRGRLRALVAAAAAVAAGVLVAGGLLLRGSDGLSEIRPMSVGVIDPSTGKLVADIPLGFESSLIAAGEGLVWVLDPQARTLTRIDPETRKVVAPTRGIPADGIPLALTVGEGSVWVAVNQGHALAVIEIGPELNDLRDRILLQEKTGTLSVLREQVALAVGEGDVWALERGQGEVTRIDPRTGTAKRLAEGLGASSSIAAGGGAVWLGGMNGVSKLDPKTGAELGSTFVAKVLDSETTAIAVRADAVWFTGSSSARLWRIDSGGETVLDSFAVGAGPSAVAVGDEGTVWVASSVGESVSRIDPDADSAQRIGLGASPGGIVTAFERVWTSPGTALP